MTAIGRTGLAGRRRGWRFRRPRDLLRSRAAALLLALLLAGGLAMVAASASQAAVPEQPQVVIVQPDDTLWSVAARYLPSRDPYGMIDEIRRLNDLPDLTIHPGQRLRVPRR